MSILQNITQDIAQDVLKNIIDDGGMTPPPIVSFFLTDESGNFLTDESGNFLITDI